MESWHVGIFLLPLRRIRMFSSTGSLAQLVEHNTFNVGVSGSSPERATGKERESTERRFALLFFPQMDFPMHK